MWVKKLLVKQIQTIVNETGKKRRNYTYYIYAVLSSQPKECYLLKPMDIKALYSIKITHILTYFPLS